MMRKNIAVSLIHSVIEQDIALAASYVLERMSCLLLVAWVDKRVERLYAASVVAGAWPHRRTPYQFAARTTPQRHL